MVISKAQSEIALMLNTDEAENEAREIIREICGKTAPFTKISDRDYKECIRLANLRLTGQPLQYIFGHWEFYGHDFSVGEGVLIPRPETELLCELAINHLKNKDGRFVDLCAGSGCISITCALESGCKGTGIEISEKAFGFFKENIEKNSAGNLVTAVNGDIFDENIISGFEDNTLAAVLSNPPYISARDMAVLQSEVRYEPELALFGGEDGYDYYRRIFPAWCRKLKPGGLLAVEIGEEQGETVSHLISKQGLDPHIIKDYSGCDRIVYAVR